MTAWNTTLSTALADAWALVAPVDCAGCGAPDRALCRECAPALRSRLRCAVLDRDDVALPLVAALSAECSGAQLPLVAALSAECMGAQLPLVAALSAERIGAQLPLVAALSYDGVVRRVVLALKHEGRTELARVLAVPLLEAVTAAWRGSGAQLLVPVPGSRTGAARRGFAPAALIARRAGLVVTPALRVAASGPEQKALRLEQRLAADATRWRASPRVSGRRVLLIDDVVTSGATLRAAARALREAGAEVAGCAAIAATPRRQGTSSIHWRFMVDDDQRHGDNGPGEDYREGKEA